LRFTRCRAERGFAVCSAGPLWSDTTVAYWEIAYHRRNTTMGIP
jgi:hypothetical protein